MMELTAHQGSVGKVLKAGSVLLAEGQLTEDEENEIREQMNLLNSRWEHLRVASMERQSRYCLIMKLLEHVNVTQKCAFILGRLFYILIMSNVQSCLLIFLALRHKSAIRSSTVKIRMSVLMS